MKTNKKKIKFLYQLIYAQVSSPLICPNPPNKSLYVQNECAKFISVIFSFDNPKSVNFICPPLSNNTFSGFKSL